MRTALIRTSGVLAASALLAACSDTTKPAADRPVSLSFSTAPSLGATLSTSPLMRSSRSVTATAGSNTVVIEKVQLVVARMELEREGAACASTAVAGDDEVDEHQCAELTLAPSIIDLPVDGSVTSVLNVTVPAGSYRALEAKVRAIRADNDRGQAAAAFLAAHPDLAGVSVRVEGAYNGAKFVYTGNARAEFETAFNPALTVDTAPVNLTVHVDVARWFKDATGAVIDPATAAPGGANANLVADNITRSFRAFHDDDRNGTDDDHR